MQIDHHSNTQYGCPHVVKDPAPMWTQDGQQGRAVERDQPIREAVGGNQPCRGGQLGVTRPAEEGSWGQIGGRGAVRHQSDWHVSG